MLWEGDDLALFKSLLGELEATGIRYFDQPLSVYPGVRRWDQFPVQPITRFGYQVAVLSSELGSARQILGKLLERNRKIWNYRRRTKSRERHQQEPFFRKKL
jgi:hypothetical protein